MIKVASYNMRKGIGTDRRRSPERVLEVLREIDADVIALQEADRRFGLRAAVLTPHLLEEHSDWKMVPPGAARRVQRLARQCDPGPQGCRDRALPAVAPAGARTTRRRQLCG